MFSFLKTMFSPVIAILDFITKYFKTIVFLTIMYFILAPDEANVSQVNNTPNLQKIELVGPILNVNKVLEKIDQAKSAKNIKGVLLEINSPGGAVAPSVELSIAIKELSAVKPVVAYSSGVMASGSYYAAIWANKIYANPGSMVGSIGVIFQGANVSELMQKVGINTQTVKAGRFKEAGTPTRDWNSYEKEELEKVINDTYDMFITDVANARKLKKSDHKEFADAHIFTSRQAKKVGLVDEVATVSAAKSALYEMAEIAKPIWKKQDKFEKFMDKIISEAVTNFSVNFMGGLKAY